jgi:hypothetical protein
MEACFTELLDATRFSAQELRSALDDSYYEQMVWLEEEFEVLFGTTDENKYPKKQALEIALHMAFYYRRALKESDHYQHELSRRILSLIEAKFPEIYKEFLAEP